MGIRREVLPLSPVINVGDQASFENAINTAATDGTETDLCLTNDITLTDRIIIDNNKNIRITTNNAAHKLMIGDQIRVGNAKLTIDGTTSSGTNGIEITKPATGTNPGRTGGKVDTTDPGWESYWPVLDVILGGTVTLNNTNLDNFTYVYGATGVDASKQTLGLPAAMSIDTISLGPVVVNGSGVLNLTGKTSVSHNHLYIANNPVMMLATPGIALRKGGSCNMRPNTSVSYNQVSDPAFFTPTSMINSIGGGAFMLDGGNLNATDGTISNNSDVAGAISTFAFADIIGDDAPGHTRGLSTVNLTGTKVQNNHGYNYGAIFLRGLVNSTIKADSAGNDAQITGNYAGDPTQTAVDYYLHSGFRTQEVGGGITLSDGFIQGDKTDTSWWDQVHVPVPGASWTRVAYLLNPAKEAQAAARHYAHLTINGANISNNTATGRAGGLFIDSSGLTIEKATISNNTSKYDMGGGMYLSSVPYTIKLKKAVIYNNQAVPVMVGGHPYGESADYDQARPADPSNPASPTDYSDTNDAIWTGSGGGVWLCPTGSADIKITDGMGIFDNTALKGADIWNERKDPGVTATVANRALGGGDTNWKYDGGSAGSGHGDGQPFNGGELDSNVGLKSNLSADNKTLAKYLAQVKIFGNKAAWGGGIGGNGGLITDFMEIPSPGNPPASYKDIVVHKHWTDSATTHPAVTVKVQANDPTDPTGRRKLTVTTLTLDQANNWTYTLTDLPVEIHYFFTEDPVTGYTLDSSAPASLTQIMPGDPDYPATPAPHTTYWHITLTNAKSVAPAPTPGGGPGTPTVTKTIRIVTRWRDGGDVASRPAAVRYDLYQVNGGRRTFLRTITVTAADEDAAGDWIGEISGLPDADSYVLIQEMIDQNGDGVDDYQVSSGRLTHENSNDPDVDLWQIVFTDAKAMKPAKPAKPNKPKKPKKPKPRKPRKPAKRPRRALTPGLKSYRGPRKRSGRPALRKPRLKRTPARPRPVAKPVTPARQKHLPQTGNRSVSGVTYALLGAALAAAGLLIGAAADRRRR